jgi:predicted O-methyltransferase YrrM
MLDDRTLTDHMRMLQDTERLGPFARALRAACPERTVAEIGVGLGPLSLIALQAGARRVYGIEVDPRTLQCTVDLLAAHGFGPDRFVPLVGRSDEIALPEPVDVIVGELIDSIGIGENAGYYLGDARRRWLRPDGVVIPGRMRVDVALAASEQLTRERRFWTEILPERHGLDYGPIVDRLASPRRTLRVEPDEILSTTACWQDVDFGSGRPVAEHRELDLEVTATGRADGIVVHFRLELGSDEIFIDTAPERTPTCWEQGFLPLPRGLDVEAGQHLRLELTAPPTREPWAPVQAALDLGPSVAAGHGGS